MHFYLHVVQNLVEYKEVNFGKLLYAYTSYYRVGTADEAGKDGNVRFQSIRIRDLH